MKVMSALDDLVTKVANVDMPSWTQPFIGALNGLGNAPVTSVEAAVFGIKAPQEDLADSNLAPIVGALNGFAGSPVTPIEAAVFASAGLRMDFSPFQDFTEREYARMHTDISGALEQADEKPALVFVGEADRPEMTIGEYLGVSRADENQVRAAAVPAMAAVKAATDLTGDPSRVVIAVDLDPASRESIEASANFNNPEEWTPLAGEFAALMADEGYRVVYADVARETDEGAPDPNRYSAMTDTIGREALRTDALPPEVMVVFGRAELMGVFQGYDLEDIEKGGVSLRASDTPGPLDTIYRSQLFYNASSDGAMENMGLDIAGYIGAPENAAQVDIPDNLPNGISVRQMWQTVVGASVIHGVDMQAVEAGMEAPIPEVVVPDPALPSL